MLKQVKEFHVLVLKLLDGDALEDRFEEFVQSAANVRKVVKVVMRNSEEQIEARTLSKSQKELYELMKVLCANLKNSIIAYKQNNRDAKCSLWEMPDKANFLMQEQIEFAGRKDIEETKEACQRVMTLLNLVVSPSSFASRIRYFFTDSTLGSLDYVTARVML